MKNNESFKSSLQELQSDNIRKQKRGLHFILTSVIIWLVIFIIHMSSLSIVSKNLLTFLCSPLLLPVAYTLSLILKIDFQNKNNPLTAFGLIVSLNQMLYMLIAMWVFTAVPDKTLMIYAIIFGAHLLPYSWIYQSKSYLIFSILIPASSLLIGISYPSAAVAIFMFIAQIIFSILLMIENLKVR